MQGKVLFGFLLALATLHFSTLLVFVCEDEDEIITNILRVVLVLLSVNLCFVDISDSLRSTREQ